MYRGDVVPKTISLISFIPSERSSIGMLVRAWKRVNSQKLVKTWLHWRRTMRKSALRQRRVKGRRKVMVMNSEAKAKELFMLMNSEVKQKSRTSFKWLHANTDTCMLLIRGA